MKRCIRTTGQGKCKKIIIRASVTYRTPRRPLPPHHHAPLGIRPVDQLAAQNRPQLPIHDVAKLHQAHDRSVFACPRRPQRLPDAALVTDADEVVPHVDHGTGAVVVVEPRRVAHEILRQARLGVGDECREGIADVVYDGDASALVDVLAENGDVVYSVGGRWGCFVVDFIARVGCRAVRGGAEMLDVVA